MAVQWQEWVDEVKQFDINDINEGNIGAWPVLVRAALWVLAFVLVLVGGYFYVSADLRVELDNAVAKEAKLKT